MCDSLIFDPTSISPPEPPLLLSNGCGNGRSGRIQNRNHKIVVPVWLRLREIVNPFDQEKFSREIFLAHTLLQFSLSTAEICMWWTRFYRAIGDGFFGFFQRLVIRVAVQKDRGLGERDLSNVTSFKSWLRCETKTCLAINILDYQTYIDRLRDILWRKREKSKIKGNSKLLWANSWLNWINVAKIGEKRISGIIGFWLRMNSCWAGTKNLFLINVGPLSNADLIFCKVSLLFPS